MLPPDEEAWLSQMQTKADEGKYSLTVWMFAFIAGPGLPTSNFANLGRLHTTFNTTAQ